MKAGQSPKSTANYKGRKKGARSAAWHEFMPAIREMSKNHLTLAEMSAQTRVPFSTIAKWINDDAELKEHYAELPKTMVSIVRAEAFKGMANSLPRLAAMSKSTNASVALRSTNQLNVIFETAARYEREEQAVAMLEERMAAIQEAQAELAHSSPIAALEPVDVEVAPAEFAETLPQQIAFMDDEQPGI